MTDQFKAYKTYRDSHTDPVKGVLYDHHYETNPWDSLMWTIERQLLDQILDRYFRGREIHLLDFACGTGRLTAFLEDRVTTSHGVDISESMLEQARKKLHRTNLIQADLTAANPFGRRRFNLITAFRFFLNAERPLRLAAMRALAPLLTDDGILVFNNHRNRAKPSIILHHISARTDTRKPTRYNIMSIQEMHVLALRGGLQVTELMHAGVLIRPIIRLLPPSWTHAIETACSRTPVALPFSQDILAVCRHREASADMPREGARG